MSIIEQFSPQPKTPSLPLQAGVLAAVTVAAIALGWFAGQYLNRSSAEAAAAVETQDAAAEQDQLRGTEIQLEAITTNLAVPNTMWVRLEASIVLDQPPSPTLADEIHQDLLAYMRTVKVYQIEGASGFRNLKADLEERARIRSSGHVKQVLIRTLLFE
ncbi:flagellar basal body-associated FliL family protein [Mesorhizobium sp. KR2-14]|uniref:flagellar basal body-associated FliL family protein n=1 Tax=Mesorhizobium sp. KR2-14 TaxID=3156610 RepID=UPI0032B545C7